MTRKWLTTGCVALAGGALIAAAVSVADGPRPASGPGPAFKGDGAEVADMQPAASLPIAQVLLYSSGVGYFQREGTVDGDARVDLTFPAQDINDLLKSMVVQDLDGGHIASRLV